jgi:hypothetical protein
MEKMAVERKLRSGKLHESVTLGNIGDSIVPTKNKKSRELQVLSYTKELQ